MVGAGAWRRATDVQVEFVMLDPYVRKTLHHHNKVPGLAADPWPPSAAVSLADSGLRF